MQYNREALYSCAYMYTCTLQEGAIGIYANIQCFYSNGCGDCVLGDNMIESLVTDIQMVTPAPLVVKRKVCGSTSLVPLTVEVR